MTSSYGFLLSHLPYLRRYARALTGSQSRGDKYVAATLEAILAEVDPNEMAARPKIALFRTFHDVWLRLVAPLPPEAAIVEDEERRSVKRTLAALSRTEREVYLLSQLEQFSPAEIAIILRAETAEIERQLEFAVDKIAEVPPARILIIEDDPVIALSNAQLVRDMGHIVAGMAGTTQEALALSDAASPDLLLVDLRLRGGDSGLDTVNTIIKSSSAPVIFVTGHPEDLLTGKKREPAFILTKPFDPEALKAMVSHALSFRGLDQAMPAVAAMPLLGDEASQGRA